jgi:hypothetical protein
MLEVGMRFYLGRGTVKNTLARTFLGCLAIAAVITLSPHDSKAAPLDGITIVRFSDDKFAGGFLSLIAADDPAAMQKDTLTGMIYLVTFVSSRGSYGAVVSDRPGYYGGCTSLAIPGSYTGTTITFGMDASAVVRKQRLETYCPTFTLRLEDAATVRVTAGNQLSSQMNIVARIPLRAVDFESAHFVKHDLKGVRLGPVKNRGELNPLRAAGYGLRYKGFRRQVKASSGQANNILGHAAAAEMTGWPWDVLYYAQFTEKFPSYSTFAAFNDAVVEKYGEPSSRHGAYMLWIYDLEGQKISLSQTPNACQSTLDLWVKYDQLRRAHGMDWRIDKGHDLSPWGCSLIMEINGNQQSGGVSGYRVQALSGYAMALNYFSQQVEKTEELKKKIEALQSSKPKF